MKQVQKTRAIFLAKWDLPHPCLASSAKLSNGRLKSIKRFNFWSTIKFHYIKWEKSNEKGLSILSSRLWCDFLTEDCRISVVVLMFEVPIPVLQIHGTYVIFSLFGYCWCRKKKRKPKEKASENAEDWSNFSAAFALVPHYATGNLSSTTSIEDKVH